MLRLRTSRQVLFRQQRREGAPLRPHSRTICWAYKQANVEEAKQLLDFEAYKFLDVRPAKEYDEEHLTKPPRCSINVPITLRGQPDTLDPAFVAKAQKQCRPTAKLLVACADGGQWSQKAMELLVEAGFTEAVLVEGGYAAWRKVFSTGGKRRPVGRWMPTGQEALKSGLPIKGAADSYEDNMKV